jgi:DNA-3-methyladenine glycosylase
MKVRRNTITDLENEFITFNWGQHNIMRKLNRSFYTRKTLEVARELLGKYLVRRIEGTELIGKIVEVEAYLGPKDKAAHSYGGRRTERNEVMYGEAGHAYVFVIYGMYNCMNVITEGINIPQGVLLRALEPISGQEDMAQCRYSKSYKDLSKRELINMSNGPGKLCMALSINRKHNGEDLCGDNIYIIEGESKQDFEVVESKRINIDYAEEAKDYLWRFYIKDNKYVSILKV